MPEKEQIIITRDDYPLVCLQYDYTENINPIGVILITPAMATKQYFYRKLAVFFANQNFIVFSMDYRGIGLSKLDKLRKLKSNINDWRNDIEDVIEWIKEHYPNLPLIYYAHSLGGQLFGILKNNNDVTLMIVVSSQNGYWRYYKTKKYYYLFFWYLIVPSISRIFRYFPSNLFNLGENMPRNVMLQWKKWCTNRDYLYGDANVTGISHTTNFKGKVLSYSFTDDPWITQEAVDYLLDKLINAKIDRRHLNPIDVGLDRIGHFGFFKEKSQKLWKESYDWIKKFIK